MKREHTDRSLRELPTEGAKLSTGVEEWNGMLVVRVSAALGSTYASRISN
jgi:hypothetical protein